jgi:4-diphosphocytidyl-2-C-methyl-D-erythritol kinase
LDVGPRGPDGYHAIDTVFQAIDLRDELRIEPLGGTSLAADDLVVRALRLVDSARDWGASLTKRIPIQAGLGGGSSDAAGALLAASRLLNGPSPYPPPQAGEGMRLGSDVPFFLIGGAARGQGRGERLTPLPDLPECWFCLCRPERGMSTVEAYGLLDQAEREPGTATARLVSGWNSIDTPRALAGYLANDFQPVIARARPDVAEVAQQLREAALAVNLCGSGSCVAGLCADEQAAKVLAERMAKLGLWSAAARALRRDEWP